MSDPDDRSLLDEGHHLVAALETGIHRLRTHFAQQTWRETAMEFLDDLIASGQKLKAERTALLTDRDSQKARADKAESDLASLHEQVAADEAKAKSALADIQAEIAAEAPATPVTSTATTAAGATVTSVVDPSVGNTVATAVDPSTGAATVTTLDHTSGASSTTDASGSPVLTDPAVHDVAVQAATAAGVVLPTA